MISYIQPKDSFIEYGIREAFELLKTPFELYDPKKTYDLIFSTNKIPSTESLVILASADITEWDKENQINKTFITDTIEFQGKKFSLKKKGFKVMLTPDTKSGFYDLMFKKGNVIRITYDPFYEISYLLNHGQSTKQCKIPSCDHHLNFIREILINNTLYVEIPPTPLGYNFSVALTHDVEHISLRDHLFDPVHLMSIKNALKRRNYKTAYDLISFPLCLHKDPWDKIDKLLSLEKDEKVKSTFFFIPSRKQKKSPDGKPHRTRAPKYKINKLNQKIQNIRKQGFEVGVHGLNSWTGLEEAKTEKDLIGGEGIRMHWLFGFESDYDYGFTTEDNMKTLKIFENAGYKYDSSMGFNDVSGYKPGTTFLYKPYNLEKILEIPFQIMDGCIETDPNGIDEILEYVLISGGVLTIIWHTHMISSEKYLKQYSKIIEWAKSNLAWLTTSKDIVDWYLLRRKINLKTEKTKENIKITVGGFSKNDLPDYRLRVYNVKHKIQKTSMDYEKGPNFFDFHLEPGEIIIEYK